MSLVEQDNYNGLPVCKRCGWSVISVDQESHDERCLGTGELYGKRPDTALAKLGAGAKALANSIPNVESTKLGYGSGKLTFNYDDNASITFRCIDEDTFSVDHIWCLNNLDADAARDLVQTLAAWRARRK